MNHTPSRDSFVPSFVCLIPPLTVPAESGGTCAPTSWPFAEPRWCETSASQFLFVLETVCLRTGGAFVKHQIGKCLLVCDATVPREVQVEGVEKDV